MLAAAMLITVFPFSAAAEEGEEKGYYDPMGASDAGTE